VLIALRPHARILEVDLADGRVLVEPGVPNLDVSARWGRPFFPPDPSSQIRVPGHGSSCREASARRRFSRTLPPTRTHTIWLRSGGKNGSPHRARHVEVRDPRLDQDAAVGQVDLEDPAACG